MKNLQTLDEDGYYDKLNKRRYFYSLNLEKPKIEYNLEHDYLEDDEYVDCFVNTKKNGFNNSYIEESVYTLNEESIIC